MKKIISTFLVIIMLFGIGCGTNLFAFAAGDPIEFDNSNIKTIFDVKNNKYNGVTSTNLGGISVGTANNRLFCVKSNFDEVVGTLYYYNNIYDNRFNTGKKTPKKIVFVDGLLGHANAMAIDDSYVYVTMAQKNGTEKTAILRISRLAISALKDGDVVSKTRTTVKDTNGNTLKIYTVLRPKTTSGATYTKSISFITRYTSNKNTGVTKFIIGYPNGKQKLGFTIATLSGDNFTVSTSKDDLFYVNNPYAKAANDSSVFMQDIFYDAYYGLFIPMWMYGGEDAINTQNYVLRVDIRGLKTQGKTENLVLNPLDVISINKTEDQNGTLSHFEIESIAFIKRNENRVDSAYKFIFSCNKKPTRTAQNDSIEELVGFTDQVNQLS
ncbi:MAG: hypothetical protein Q4D20_06130 [Clostridia bacterium]|nr:hypothetical protein [Clostridia bacterium]